jgi:hypothetical protein
MVNFGCFRFDITTIIKIKGMDLKTQAMFALKSYTAKKIIVFFVGVRRRRRRHIDLLHSMQTYLVDIYY